MEQKSNEKKPTICGFFNMVNALHRYNEILCEIWLLSDKYQDVLVQDFLKLPDVKNLIDEKDIIVKRFPQIRYSKL